MQKRIGELLSERRQAMGASLADVEGATLIRSAYIEALEKGNYSSIPGQIYVRLYVKSYASFLGMDPQQAAEMLDRELRESGAAQPNGSGAHEAAYDRRSLQRERIEQRKRAAARKRTLMTALVIAVLTILVLAVYLLSGGSLGGIGDGNVAAPPAASGLTDEEPAAPDELPAGPATATAPAELSYAHVLRLDFSDDCWIRAYADGAKVREGIWRNGTSLTIEAEQGIWVRLGNAGGARLIYNGSDLGNPGLLRKVMDISFPSGYEPF